MGFMLVVHLLRKNEGVKPLQKQSSPSPLRERGIKGVRVIKTSI